MLENPLKPIIIMEILQWPSLVALLDKIVSA